MPNYLLADEVVSTRLNVEENWVEVLCNVRGDNGKWFTETNGYLQLAAGQNYWDQQSASWHPSQEKIEVGKVGDGYLPGR